LNTYIFSVGTNFEQPRSALDLVTSSYLVNFAGLNMKVCTVISVAQFLLWALWAIMTRHPSRLKILFVAIGGVFSVSLEAYDIPPQWGYVDGRAICLGIAIPLSYIWWMFAKEDAEMRTSAIMKKTR
jgi:post-GPI attachment to proteins factor 3